MEKLEREEYQSPVMEVTTFQNDDIITTSSYEPGPDEGDPV